jgi:hypothetical protein
MTSEQQAQRPAGAETTGSVPIPETLNAEAGKVLGGIAGAVASAEAESLGGTGLTRVLASEVLTFAAEVHKYHRENIVAADQKAGFIFAISSALLVYLYQQQFHLGWLRHPPAWSAADLSAFAAMAALFVALCAAAFAVMPRFASTHKGQVFFRSVAAHQNATDYASAISRESGDALTMDLLKHVYDLSRICTRKYDAVGIAVIASSLGVVISIGVLLFGRPAS